VNIFLWIVAGLLAAVFLMAGTMKVTRPKEQLLPMMAWSKTVPDGQLKALGTIEVLGAVGLILPRALNIAPVLTPVAAVGCAIVMTGAVILHATRKEYKEIVFPPLVLLILAVIVAAGRF
jgi:uncharacterized membrane protein YphA (DoxX/SURF4 family)